jgi:hypothetical protein
MLPNPESFDWNKGNLTTKHTQAHTQSSNAMNKGYRSSSGKAALPAHI